MDKKIVHRIGWMVLIVGLCVFVDQYTKILALEKLAVITEDGRAYSKPTVKVVGDFFTLMYRTNSGAFLGMGNTLNEPWKTILLNLVPALFVLFAMWMVVYKKLSKLEFLGMTFIIGGGIGNIIDRLLLSRTINGVEVILNREVVDFMYFDTGIGILHTGVVNVADIVITAAVFLLMIEYFFIKKEIGHSA